MVNADLGLDLTICDREPIHIPGSIQTHGVLLTVDPQRLTVLQVAGETSRFLGAGAEDIHGKDLAAIVGTDAVGLIGPLLGAGLAEPLFLGSIIPAPSAGRLLDLTAHARSGVLILELEPAATPPETAAAMMSKVRRISTGLGAAADMARLLGTACREVRALTGFARVMIYRFLDDGAGVVEAEDKREDLGSFLNHHYPASDIPKQARALYLQNLIRVIPDSRYTPAPLTPGLNPVTGEPLDMSDCALRSVSPIHLQYLKNLGVVASMSVSVVVDGRLWGLISCHDTEPRLVPYELREACKHVGQILSEQIKAREEAEASRQAASLARKREDVVGVLARQPSAAHGLLDHAEQIRGLVPADGAAVMVGREVRCLGHAPTEAEIGDLAQWLLRPGAPDTYAAQNLARDYAPAVAYATRASGVLAGVVSREEAILLLWFRAEYVETVNWAGNPHKPIDPGGELGDLTPRKSFEIWKETVRHQSKPWTLAEISAAGRFSSDALELLRRNRLHDLNVQLRRTLADKEALLAQKDLLMQEVHHRVQNSLQLVDSMLHLQAKQNADEQVGLQLQEASRRIRAVSAVHRRLWRRSDHIQSVDFGIYLEELHSDLLETWGPQWAGYITVDARSLLIPTDKALTLALVVTELLTNAVKYAYGGESGPIELTMKEEGRREISITVRDHGVGMQASASGSRTGLGSRLTSALIGQLGGHLEVASKGPGTTVTLTVPVGGVATLGSS